ncbi:MAG: hypothetical protein ABI378_03675 [Chitinophagaceae bacterium]
MKKVFSTFALFVTSFCVSAKVEKQPIFAYVTSGSGLGNVEELQLEANLIFNKHHHISVGYQSRRTQCPGYTFQLFRHGISAKSPISYGEFGWPFIQLYLHPLPKE